MKRNKDGEVFLTVEQAFDKALDSLKDKSNDEERGKIYVWRQRYREGNLSHKKIAGILEKAGFHKVVEEKWMPIDPKAQQSEEFDDEPFKD
jgi:hypothetical protein